MRQDTYIDAVLSGDRDAFAHLIEPYLPLWLHIAGSWTGNQQDAEDAVQEALIQCFRHLNQFRRDAEFATWVTRIVIRQCHRITARRQDVGVDAGVVGEGWTPGFEGLVALEDTIRDTFTVDELWLFHQAVKEGRNWPEMAQERGEQVGALKTRWWRMKKRLKRALEEGRDAIGR